MKILHTADWHLGKVFEHSQVNFSLLEEQRQILEKIVKIANEEKVDVVVIAGDIFDSYNPPNEARLLFNETITELSKQGERPVIVISGNHDSPEGLATIKPLTANHGIIIHHLPVSAEERHLRGKNFEVEIRGNWLRLEKGGESAIFFLLPFVSETRLNEAFIGDNLLDKTLSYNEKIEKLISKEPPFDGDTRILVSHIFIDSGVEAGSEKKLILGSSYLFESSRIPESFDLVLLGHLHKSQKIGERIFYSGSIFPMNLAEIERSPAKYVSIFEPGKSGFSYQEIEILPGDYVRVREFEDLESALREIENLKTSLVYIKIKRPLTNHETLVELRRALRENLLGITFEVPELVEGDYFEKTDLESLTDEELFREFYRHQMGKDPDDRLVEVFIRILNEVRHEAH